MHPQFLFARVIRSFKYSTLNIVGACRGMMKTRPVKEEPEPGRLPEGCALLWPPQAIACLTANLEQQACAKACFASRGHAAGKGCPATATILQSALHTLVEQRVGFAADAADVAREAELTEFALCFVADMLESSALVSLLTPAERRAVSTVPRAYKPQAVTLPLVLAAATGASPPPAKKHHAQHVAGIAAPEEPHPLGAHLSALCFSRHFVNTLPVEYLLRVLAALPALVDHFLVLNASAHDGSDALCERVDRTAHTVSRWLWPRVQGLLDFVEERVNDWATPPAKYMAVGS